MGIQMHEDLDLWPLDTFQLHFQRTPESLGLEALDIANVRDGGAIRGVLLQPLPVGERPPGVKTLRRFEQVRASKTTLIDRSSQHLRPDQGEDAWQYLTAKTALADSSVASAPTVATVTAVAEGRKPPAEPPLHRTSCADDASDEEDFDLGALLTAAGSSGGRSRGSISAQPSGGTARAQRVPPRVQVQELQQAKQNKGLKRTAKCEDLSKGPADRGGQRRGAVCAVMFWRFVFRALTWRHVAAALPAGRTWDLYVSLILAFWLRSPSWHAGPVGGPVGGAGGGRAYQGRLESPAAAARPAGVRRTDLYLLYWLSGSAPRRGTQAPWAARGWSRRWPGIPRSP